MSDPDATIEFSMDPPPADDSTATTATAVVPRLDPGVDAPAAEGNAVPAPPPDSEFVTCPECGNGATVTLNRRQAEDFCRNCDYPLFWTPSLIVLDHGALGEDSLRRLPGTTGRALIASVPCPHCAEPNTVGAQVCVRCGESMHVVAPPPPPAPVYTPPPPPVVVEPPKQIPWWVWFLVALAVIGVAVGILYGTGTIG